MRSEHYHRRVLHSTLGYLWQHGFEYMDSCRSELLSLVMRGCVSNTVKKYSVDA